MIFYYIILITFFLWNTKEHIVHTSLFHTVKVKGDQEKARIY